MDFGLGRKLERFGAVILDRPCPAAEGSIPAQPEAWTTAHVVLDHRGSLKAESPACNAVLGDSWVIRFQSLRLALRLTPFGHVGIFPEQAANWLWLQERLSSKKCVARVPVALNLFAYTGASSLVMAGCGAQVVHVDASAPAVSWARANAQCSQLHNAPIRWIVEDVRKFISRELRRGRRYDFIVLDPPSYGHGPRGQRWEIEFDLPPLLQQCCRLLNEEGELLLTAHSEQPGVRDVIQMLPEYVHSDTSSGRLQLEDVAGRRLDAGFYIRAKRVD